MTYVEFDRFDGQQQASRRLTMLLTNFFSNLQGIPLFLLWKRLPKLIRLLLK